MARRKISVVVVDDSVFIRRALKRILHTDRMIRVIGEAANGLEAIQAVKTYRPDVVTMDIKMPGMNGLQALRVIMNENPVPILIVSALTNAGGAITLQALAAGAVDFIDKTTCQTMLDILDISEPLVQKVKILAGIDPAKIAPVRRIHRKRRDPVVKPADDNLNKNPTHLVAIGASTGGPMSLEKIMAKLPQNYPGALLVVQHMPPGFTLSFAERLDSLCSLKVTEACQNDPIRPGQVYIAPAEYHLKIKKSGGNFQVDLSMSPRQPIHRPSVDVLMDSVATHWPGKILGILLTGMGQDGVQGVQAINQRGGRIIAQDKETCIVFGMPKAAQQAGYVHAMVPLDRIHHEIITFNSPSNIKRT